MVNLPSDDSAVNPSAHVGTIVLISRGDAGALQQPLVAADAARDFGLKLRLLHWTYGLQRRSPKCCFPRERP